MSDFDILAEAEKTMTGISREVKNVKVDGTLTITLKAEKGKSLISGIELIRVP